MTATRTGVMTALASVAAAVLGWVFGLPELSILAAAGIVLVGAAALWVGVGAQPLSIVRAARPGRLQVDERCEIRLATRNDRRRTSPVTVLQDRVDHHGVARLMLAPLRPGERVVATYSLPTGRRGLHHVGPLTTIVEDPLGLVRRTRTDDAVRTVVVLPRIVRLEGLPAAPGDEPEHGTQSLTSTASVDEEFASLREYVPGDDVRRIHWRSTARRGRPVVRQFDVPWQRRTTVLVDLRPGPDSESFERAVSVAASVVALVARRDELVRLVTTAGDDTGFLPAADELDGLLDRLAVVTAEPPTRDRPRPLRAAVADLARRDLGRLVTVTAGLDAVDARELSVAGRGIGTHVLVSTAVDAVEVAGPEVHQVRAPSITAATEGWAAMLDTASSRVASA